MTPPRTAPLMTDALDLLRTCWTDWFPEIRQPQSLSYVIQGTGVGKLIVFVFGTASPQPICILKLPRSRRDNASLAHEYRLIKELRTRGGRLAQATLPEPVAAPMVQGWQVVVEKMLPGSLLSSHVPVGPRFSLRFAAQQLFMLRDWLMSLQQSISPHSHPLSAADVSQFFIQPIEQAQRGLDWSAQETSFLDLARETARTLVGRPLPIGFVHGDLRPGNLLVGNGQLHVLDWQFGQLRGLPMLDWFEFVFRYYCDTTHLEEITGHRDQYRTAFTNVFMGGHPYSQLAMEETKACAQGLGVTLEQLHLLLTMWLVDNSNKYLCFLSDRAEHGYLYFMQNPTGAAQPSFRQQLRRQVYPYLLGVLAKAPENGPGLPIFN